MHLYLITVHTTQDKRNTCAVNTVNLTLYRVQVLALEHSTN